MEIVMSKPWHGIDWLFPLPCYSILGVELNRLCATWACNKKNLWAQLHSHEPNIVREISIFNILLQLNIPYLFHFAENRYTAVDSPLVQTSALTFHVSSHIFATSVPSIIKLDVHIPGDTWATSIWTSNQHDHF